MERRSAQGPHHLGCQYDPTCHLADAIDPDLLGRGRDRENRVCLRVLMNAKNGSDWATHGLNLLSVGVQERDDPPGCIDRLLWGLLHTCEKELQRRFLIP